MNIKWAFVAKHVKQSNDNALEFYSGIEGIYGRWKVGRDTLLEEDTLCDAESQWRIEAINLYRESQKILLKELLLKIATSSLLCHCAMRY